MLLVTHSSFGFREHAAMLEIYYEQMTYEIIRESQSYQVFSFPQSGFRFLYQVFSFPDSVFRFSYQVFSFPYSVLRFSYQFLSFPYSGFRFSYQVFMHTDLRCLLCSSSKMYGSKCTILVNYLTVN